MGAATDRRHRVVAVVDDDPAVLDSLRFVLEVAGHKVCVYASAAAFLEDRVPQPDRLILDHHMPDMTGLELAARVRSEGRKLPMLLISAAPSDEMLRRAAELGIAKILEKPVAENELLSFVEGPAS
jgi:FixJ family two-component response regulator